MSALPPFPPASPALHPQPRNPDAFIPDGRSVDPVNGWRWIVDGWNLFLRAPGMWVLLLVVFVVILAVLSFVPLVGGAAAALLAPVLTGGLMLACATAAAGESPQIEQLFAGFRQNTAQLAVVGVFHLVASVVIALVLMLFVGANVGVGTLVGGMLGHPGLGAATGGMLSLLLAALVGTALAVVVYAAIWFAPALIVFHNMEAVAALRASLFASLKNVFSMLVYGVIVFVLAIVAAIPFSLGFLVLVPVLTGSVYAAYRDVFFASATRPSPSTAGAPPAA